MNKRVVEGVAAALLLAAAGVLLVKHQAVADWWRLRGYTPPAAVAGLAADDTMTAEAKHVFYVNHPQVTTGHTFTNHCPAGSEKTVVLGCYVGSDAGIYIYKVDDARLDGVEQVTAAHEMLHAAYRRLSSGERAKVDAMLLDYYQHQLTDQRIKSTIAAYRKSEPNDVVNEMHSVFGTEIADLPAPLEQYYRQYFTDRSKVTAYTANYEGEFTSRQQQIAADDAQLKTLKSEIETDEATLRQEKAALDTLTAQLDQYRNAGDAAKYNAGVAGYNSAVDQYNGLITTTKGLISQYNMVVDQRNNVVLEEQQLTQELSANPT